MKIVNVKLFELDKEDLSVIDGRTPVLVYNGFRRTYRVMKAKYARILNSKHNMFLAFDFPMLRRE